MTIRLFVQTYTPANAQRKQELESCLAANEAIPWLTVVKVERPDRITFREWFSIMNEHVSDGDISIVANSDIKFNETLKLSEDIGEDECFALTRWDKGFLHNTGADAWIFRGKIKDIQDCDFGLGVADCDYAIAERLQRSGYRLANPSQEIQCHHLHDSKFRTYYQLKKVPKPHITHVPQLLLRDRHKKITVYSFYSESHKEMFRDYLQASMPAGTDFQYRVVPQHCQSGEYHQDGWQAQMAEKLRYLIEIAEKGETFIFLDADIKIRSPYFAAVMLEELCDADIALQKDHQTACAGCFIARGNAKTVKLFKDALDIIGDHKCDQPAINAILKRSEVKWRYLTSKFWNYSHFMAREWDGVRVFTIPSSAILVHANWTRGLDKKRRILDMV